MKCAPWLTLSVPRIILLSAIGCVLTVLVVSAIAQSSTLNVTSPTAVVTNARPTVGREQCSHRHAPMWQNEVMRWLPHFVSQPPVNWTVTQTELQQFLEEMKPRRGGSSIAIHVAHNQIHLPPDIKHSGQLHIWLQGMIQLLSRSLAACPLAPDHPDVRFILSTSDWPIAHKATFQVPPPVLGTTTTRLHWDIPVPGSVLHTWKPAAVNVTWSERKDVAFFRGSPTCFNYSIPTHCPRFLAWKHGQLFPGELDVGITRFMNITAAAGQVVTPSVPIAEHARFRYLLSFDGHSYARRFAEIMDLGSTVLKADSILGYEEFYYPLLQEWVHYVPFVCQHESCNIADVVRSLRRQPARAEWIANNLKAFAEDALSAASVNMYWHVVLRNLIRMRQEHPWASAWDAIIERFG
ncbi:MAG: hypothetical protein EOO65_02205 [Methanosarcinales archaeon]|nr:MAG: hypothetical protein EOO65_02205 [Methanosarcinales archaeon]